MVDKYAHLHDYLQGNKDIKYFNDFIDSLAPLVGEDQKITKSMTYKEMFDFVTSEATFFTVEYLNSRRIKEES